MSKHASIIHVMLMCLILMTAGCAGNRNMFVLMPSPDGHIGEAEVASSGGSRVLNQAYQATGLDDAGKAPSQPEAISEAEAHLVFGPALAAHPESPSVYLLYFEPNSSQLTKESAELVARIMNRIRETNSSDISVVGHADSVGSREANKKISTERARSISDKLVALGVSMTAIEIDSHGMENPLVPTPPGVSEPKNRRVEVVVR